MHAGGNVEGQRHVFTYAALTVTFRAGGLDDGAVAVAVGAFNLLHDGTEDGLHAALHETVTGAGGAGFGLGALCGAFTVTGLAGHGGATLNGLLNTEYRVLQADGDGNQVVLALTHTGCGAAGTCRAAGEHVQQVLKTAEAAESAARVAAASGVACAALFVAGGVVVAALFRVGEHLVGEGDALEFFGCVLGGVHVGVQLACLLSVRLLDLFGAGVVRYAESIVVAHAFPSSRDDGGAR